SAGAPDELDLFSSPFVAANLAYRIFGETPDNHEPVTHLSTELVVGAVAAAIVAGALVCWLRYRRLQAFRCPTHGSSLRSCRNGSARSSRCPMSASKSGRA